MNADELRHPITFEKMSVVQDDIGNEIKAWSYYYNCRASVNGLSGSEYWAAKAQQAEETVVFTVRYCENLKNINPQEYRISFRGEIYDIQPSDNYKHLNESLKIKAVRHG